MELFETVCISFSGITLRFEFPSPVPLNSQFTDFLCQTNNEPDEIIQVRLLVEPLRPTENAVYTDSFNTIYRTDKGWLRIYSPLTADDGCQVACLFCTDDNVHTLYYPASMWDHYRERIRCLHLICAELILIRRNAFLLHSSVVMMHGKMVLFSGPSGAGKSTQADLWAKHLGAQVINGDRCIIQKIGDTFYGCGSPWCGTSGIHRREQAPIAGIFLVKQAAENSLVRLRGVQAFSPLYAQTLVNSWDFDFMAKITSLYTGLLAQIPVWQLNCRMDEEAVRLPYHTLF